MWTKFWEEGWKKTPIRNLWKRIPLSNPGMERLAEQVNRETEAEIDQEPAGRLELEATSPLVQMKGAATQTTEESTSTAEISVYVGPTESTITGDVRKIVNNLPKLGGKLAKGTKTWFMPSVRVHELFELCDLESMTYVEVDAEGNSVNQDAEAPKEGLFERTSPQGKARK